MPDYDGRPPPPPTLGEQLVLFPQAVFDPAYVVAEHWLRRPIGWAVSTIERKQIPAAVVDFFTFGENKQAGVVPTAFIDFGVNPSVGVYAWWDQVFAKRNSIRAQVGTWGPKWLLLSVRDRVTVSGTSYVSVYGTYTRRPDQPFFGLGPESRQRDLSRFSSHMFEGGADGWAALSRQSGLLGRVGVRRRIFSDGSAFSDPGIEESIATGRFEAPPGYENGYTAVFQRLELVLDSRPRRPAKQTGGRINFELEQGQDVANLPHGARWLRYGATGGLYYDVGRTRTIGVRGTVLMVDPLRGDVPFTEQITLGGLGPMPGYLFNRLIGRSAAVAELEYRWPIWVFFDGVLQGSVGNVFNEHLSGLSPKLMRLSGTVGFKSNNSADHQLEILTGFGTETLDDGLRVTSFRLVFGGTRGF
ncbi:MAG: hypothetical protein EOO75_13075 [Myxococcales bacterium]|nr:MAG: hypothetical protein EOO75_13075 [Myxococcales bacterium]